MGLHVSDQRGLERKAPPTFHTRVDLLSGVNSLMNNEGGFAGEVFPTFDAVIGLDRRSSASVGFGGFCTFAPFIGFSGGHNVSRWISASAWRDFLVILGVATRIVIMFVILGIGHTAGRLS